MPRKLGDPSKYTKADGEQILNDLMNASKDLKNRDLKTVFERTLEKYIGCSKISNSNPVQSLFDFFVPELKQAIVDYQEDTIESIIKQLKENEDVIKLLRSLNPSEECHFVPPRVEVNPAFGQNPQAAVIVPPIDLQNEAILNVLWGRDIIRDTRLIFQDLRENNNVNNSTFRTLIYVYSGNNCELLRENIEELIKLLVTITSRINTGEPNLDSAKNYLVDQIRNQIIRFTGCTNIPKPNNPLSIPPSLMFTGSDNPPCVSGKYFLTPSEIARFKIVPTEGLNGFGKSKDCPNCNYAWSRTVSEVYTETEHKYNVTYYLIVVCGEPIYNIAVLTNDYLELRSDQVLNLMISVEKPHRSPLYPGYHFSVLYRDGKYSVKAYKIAKEHGQIPVAVGQCPVIRRGQKIRVNATVYQQQLQAAGVRLKEGSVGLYLEQLDGSRCELQITYIHNAAQPENSEYELYWP
jgi:hypothetical protein